MLKQKRLTSFTNRLFSKIFEYHEIIIYIRCTLLFLPTIL